MRNVYQYIIGIAQWVPMCKVSQRQIMTNTVHQKSSVLQNKCTLVLCTGGSRGEVLGVTFGGPPNVIKKEKNVARISTYVYITFNV